MTTTNVSQDELNQFSSHAHDWWNPEGAFKTLHEINPLRVSYIQVRAKLRKQRILDIGCGGGLLSEALAKQGAIVTAIDLESNSLAVAKQHADKQHLAIDYQQISAETYAKQAANMFDVITCMEMLEHVPQPESIIASIAQLLKPGGLVFLSTINRSWHALLQAIVAAEFVLRLLPKGTHRYDKFIKPSELEQACRQHNLLVKTMTGITYNPLDKRFKLTNNIKVNYLIMAEKPAN